jgi:hypothetical protein
MNRRRMFRCITVAAVAAAVGAFLPAGVAGADTSPYPNPPFPSCLPEQYPHAGSARNNAFTPYEIPFSATLGQPSVQDPTGPLLYGGYLEIANGLLTVTLGGPVVPATPATPQHGSVFAHACGVLSLPNQTGGISGNPYGSAGNGHADQYNNNFQFANPIDVSIGIAGVPGAPLIHAYGSAVGDLAASIDPTPAANGGLNTEFYSSAKATSDLGPVLSFLQQLLPGGTLPPAISALLGSVTGQISATSGNECTLPLGDLRQAGVPSPDLQPGPTGVSPVTGLSLADETTPAHLTTQTSGSLTGQPVTGPITDAFATLVGNEFPVGAIDPNTPPSPDAPGAGTTPPDQLCSASNAKLLNGLIGLPSPAGKNIFYAPGTFAVHTSA